MKTRAALWVSTLTVVAASVNAGSAYKCVDASGNVTFQASPCAPADEGSQFEIPATNSIPGHSPSPEYEEPHSQRGAPSPEAQQASGSTKARRSSAAPPAEPPNRLSPESEARLAKLHKEKESILFQMDSWHGKNTERSCQPSSTRLIARSQSSTESRSRRLTPNRRQVVIPALITHHINCLTPFRVG